MDKKFKQKHHIIPRSYYKIVGIPIDNSTDNTVYLSYSDHILAHYYLCLFTKDHRLAEKMKFAFVHMSKEFSDSFDTKNLDYYDKIYEEYILYRSKLAKEQKRSPLSQETREKISVANTGKYVDDVWINKDGENRHIKKSDLESFLANGYVAGRNDPKAYRKISESQKLNPNRSMLGRHQTEYQKKTTGDKLRGVKKSDSARLNMHKARVGKVYMHNPLTMECHLVSKESIKDFENKGFVLGRISRTKTA